MTTFFLGDPHFGHRNIIEYASRPFADLDEMHDALLKRYRDRVRDQDFVIWLGDVSFLTPESTAELVRALPGRKLLVQGNHDGTLARCTRLGFDAVVNHCYLDVAGFKTTLMHRPPWSVQHPDPRFPSTQPPRGVPRDELVIHGHTHTATRYQKRCINTCVEAWDYAPVSLQEIEALVREVTREPARQGPYLPPGRQPDPEG
jgi:calcineurin-like phosphoesterase family protein